MIDVYYLETQYDYKSHDMVILELVLFLKKYYNANVIHQKGGHLEISKFNYRLPDCELLFYDNENDILRGISFSDAASGIQDIFLQRNKKNDVLLISQIFNFFSPTFDFSKLNCTISKSIYVTATPFVNYDIFYNKRRLLNEFVDKMYFKGNIDGIGRFSVYDLLKTNYFYGGPGDQNANNYFEEVIKHKVGLSIPGVGELCYRDMEYMAVGTPLLKFEYISNLNPPLIPNFHYISINRTNELAENMVSERLGGEIYANAYVKDF